MRQEIKTVAKNGQIVIGRRFAGKKVQINELDDGSLIVRAIAVIPENELWLYKGDNIDRINKSLEWIKANPRKDNFDEIVTKMEDECNKNRHK